MAMQKYTETVRPLDSEKLQISFTESVCQDFARLHETLRDEKGFDYDALRHLEDFSNPKLKRGIPVAFAGFIEVFTQVSNFARKTNNPALIAELETLQSDLSGFGAEKNPLKIVSVSNHR